MTSDNGSTTVQILRLYCIALLLLLVASTAAAEPYLAVFKGMHCSACHSHPSGGGKRSLYGNAFAQTELPAQRIGPADAGLWTGEIVDWLSVGGDLRAEYRYVDTPNQPESSEFNVTRGTVYVEANVIPGRLSLYVDQQVAPGGSINREAYVKLRMGAGKWHVAAGQFYLPYGWRLQDNSAFVRQATGINFTNPDRGVQVGIETGPWSAHFSLTNGTGGGAELDTGKQSSFIASYVIPRGRIGVSLNTNNADAGDRNMGGLFAGLRTGPIAWLGEVDWISDDLGAAGDLDAVAALVEANWLFRKGHNLKLSYDYFDPDRDIDEDHQIRWSAVWEYSPMQFLQSRVGLRFYDGIPQVDAQDRNEFFIEIHGFF